MATSRPGSKPQASIASTTIPRACSLSAQLGAVASLVADQGRLQPALRQHGADRAIHRDDHLQSLAVALRADGHDQHVLDVEIAAGVQAAGDHVDHGQAAVVGSVAIRAASLRLRADPCQSRLRWTNSSSPRAAAAAWATASETPRSALAPSRLLFGVPSSSISSGVERPFDRPGPCRPRPGRSLSSRCRRP